MWVDFYRKVSSYVMYVMLASRGKLGRAQQRTTRFLWSQKKSNLMGIN